MIRLDFPQGSEDWLYARLGIPTASQFDRIITPTKMAPSKSAVGYAHELLAEQMLDHPLSDQESLFMRRGSELEDQAYKFYEFQRDVTVDRVGFVVRDDGKVGCSPDGLVGEDGGLEIKILSAKEHVGYLLNATPDSDAYKCQIQGCMWITGREWWDWLLFNPELPSTVVRFERDEKFIGVLSKMVDAFVSHLELSRDFLTERGLLSADFVRIRTEKRRSLGLPC